jgi:hypothetical protein
MLVNQTALVSETRAVASGEVMRVAAALQKQATRDFGPIWDVQATVDPFDRLEDVPLGYWPMIIRDDIGFDGAAGIHLDKDGQPFALIQFSRSWSLTASHELLEMLADPFGNRLIAGPSLRPDQGRVEYLVEVCDPPEDDRFAYTVNDVLVSDFITPNFFDPVTAPGVRYDFTGSIDKPRQVLSGGYISWHDLASDEWFQQIFFGAEPEFRDLGPLDQRQGSLREEIDRRTPHPKLVEGLEVASDSLQAAVARANLSTQATASKAAVWHAQIDALKAAGPPR